MYHQQRIFIRVPKNIKYLGNKSSKKDFVNHSPPQYIYTLGKE